MEKDYSLFKTKAIKLRRKGLSYGEIKKEVNVSKSTLSLWLKHIPLRPEHRKRLYTKQVQILARGSQSQRERRLREVQRIIEEAEREIRKPLSFESYRLMGAALYWAEGSKGKRFQMTNSDPYLILFTVKWIKSIFNISAKNLKARLNIYSQQNDKEVKKFWSELTGIPLENFSKSYIKPPNKGYKKNNLYYGTIRVEIPKSADLQCRIFGWVKATLKSIDPKVKMTEKRWRKLTKVSRPVNIDSP